MVAGTLGRGERARRGRGSRRAPRHRPFDAVKPGDHPLDIGVDHHRRLAKGDRGDRRGGVGADPGQAEQPRLARGKAARGRDRPRAGDQIARAGIIAKPGPFAEHVLVARRGKGVDARPARDEALEARPDGGDRGLLQHHLGQPHAVRDRVAGDAPRQVAPVPVVMAKEPRRGTGKHGRYGMVRGDGEVPAYPHQVQSRRPASRLCARRGRPGRRHRRGQLQALRLRPGRDRQPLGGNRRRALRQCLDPRIGALPARQEVGRDADPDRGRGARAVDAASDPADHRARQSLLRLCRGRQDRLSPGPGRDRQAPGAAPRPSRSRASLARGCARSPIPACAPASRRWPNDLLRSDGAPQAPVEPVPFPPLRRIS